MNQITICVSGSMFQVTRVIPLPQKPRVILEEGNKGVYEIEGLYPGYGHTLGNSLRRVLLSSLKGAAITSVKIDGVSHEFSTIPGVLENVVDIILNLKQVRFKVNDTEGASYKAVIDIKGEKSVTAKDFVVPSQLEVENPELYIVSLTDKKAFFKMEAEVETGLGYQSVESRKKEKVEIGSIALDASFSPVRIVNYEVENMRVGDRTDYNLLRFHIETDGSISPREALRLASATLAEQFQELSGIFREKDRVVSADDSEDKEEIENAGFDEEEGVSKKKIEELDLSNRTMNALTKAGIKNIGLLLKKTEKKLREVEGLGEKGIQEIKKELGNLGLTLKQ